MTNSAKLKIKSRLFAIWLAIRSPHFFVVSLSSKELTDFFRGKEIDSSIIYCGMRQYIMKKIIIDMAESIDKNQMILDKAEWEFKVEEYVQSKKVKL